MSAATSEAVTFRYEGRVPTKSNFRRGGLEWRAQWRRIKEFQAEIGWLAKAAGVRVSEQPVELYIRAKSQKLDLDNCLKATIDALIGVAFVNDSQAHLIGVHIVSCGGEPGLSITIRQTTHEQRGVR